MFQEDKPILDSPEKEIKASTYPLLGYVSLGILFLGVILQMMHISGWFWLMAIGMLIMTIRTTIIFLRKRRNFFEWSYFVGRHLLFLAALLHFSGTTRTSAIFIPAFVAFLLGVIGSFVMKNANDTDDEDLDL